MLQDGTNSKMVKLHYHQVPLCTWPQSPPASDDEFPTKYPVLPVPTPDLQIFLKYFEGGTFVVLPSQVFSNREQVKTKFMNEIKLKFQPQKWRSKWKR